MCSLFLYELLLHADCVEKLYLTVILESVSDGLMDIFLFI